MKSMKNKTVKARRKFDETFKRETLNHWLTSGKPRNVSCLACESAQEGVEEVDGFGKRAGEGSPLG